MADYAPNATPRIWCDYRCFGTDHQFMWRAALGTDIADWEAMAEKMILTLNDLAPNRLASWAIRGFRYADTGSDVSFPLAVSGTLTTGGASDPSTGERHVKARAYSFVGRSVNGHPAMFFLYGLNIGVEDGVGVDFRVMATENANLAAALIRLSETAPAVCAADGAIVSWKAYANLKHNDRYVKQIRRGG